jgi:hypothetical protein
LLDNLHRERLFGTSQEIRVDRAQIIAQLNTLALQYGQQSFNDMCRSSSRARRLPQSPGPVQGTSVDIFPEVSIELLTHAVPTSYSSLLNPATFPLVTVIFDNTKPHSQDVLLSCQVYIEDYSYNAFCDLRVAKGTRDGLTFLPTLIPEKIKTLNVDRFASLQVVVDYTFPSKHRAPHTKPIMLQARNTALLGLKRAGGCIDLTRYLAGWVTPYHHEVERLLQVAAKYLPAYGFRGCVSAPTLPEMAESIREQVQAIFQFLKYDRPLTYIDASFTLMQHDNQITQRVHFPSETLSLGGSANCLDGTVLFASLLEAVGIAPLIVLIPDHALLGWKIYKDEEQEEARPDDAEIYEFLETTAIHIQDFSSACMSAWQLYNDALAQGLFDHDLDDVRGSARLIDVAVCHKKDIPSLE